MNEDLKLATIALEERRGTIKMKTHRPYLAAALSGLLLAGVCAVWRRAARSRAQS